MFESLSPRFRRRTNPIGDAPRREATQFIGILSNIALRATLDRILFAIGCAVKGVDLQRVEVPPGKGSLQPVAIGAAEEVTNLPEPLM